MSQGPTSGRGRLALVSDSVHPWQTGGKEKRHHELVTRLARRGVRVDVYTMQWWDGPREVELDGVRYVALCRARPLYSGQRRSIRQALVFALACFRLLRRDFDVVEVDAIPFLPLFPMRLVTWVKRRRMVVTWHEFWGPDYWKAYLGVRGRLAWRVEQAALSLPDTIVAASDGTAERLRTSAGRRLDVRVVANGVDLASAPTDVPPGGPELISVGRLLSNKNVDLTLDALAVLRARGRDLSLSVIGEGPEEEALHRRAERLGLGEHVVFSSFLDEHDELLRRMAAARVLVFPSVREGFGMVALEAMSVGTPVVTSDHPDNYARHLVHPGVEGELCAVDAESLADAVERVLASRDQQSAAARLAARRYDWESLTDQLAEAYGV